MLKISDNISTRNPVSRSLSGFTLVELLVGVLLSAIILGGVVLTVVRMSVSAGETVVATRLNQQARQVMEQMSRELQRAGYLDWYRSWDNCLDTRTPNRLDDINGDGVADLLDLYHCTMPAIDLVGDITLWDFPSSGDAGSGIPLPCFTECDCILYSYDFNKDGTQGVGSGVPGANQNTANMELYGFRWNDGSVEKRIGGGIHSCNSGSWRDMNDGSLNIEDMGFSLIYAPYEDANYSATMFQLTGNGSWNGQYQNSCTPFDSDTGDPLPLAEDTLCLMSRSIGISMQASLSSDAAFRVILNTISKNRNNDPDLQ